MKAWRLLPSTLRVSRLLKAEDKRRCRGQHSDKACDVLSSQAPPARAGTGCCRAGEHQTDIYFGKPRQLWLPQISYWWCSHLLDFKMANAMRTLPFVNKVCGVSDPDHHFSLTYYRS